MNCFLSLEKTVGSVDHDRTVASYIYEMKRKGYDTFLCNTGPYEKGSTVGDYEV